MLEWGKEVLQKKKKNNLIHLTLKRYFKARKIEFGLQGTENHPTFCSHPHCQWWRRRDILTNLDKKKKPRLQEEDEEEE